MEQENHFNLIDEPWIPVVDVGRVSLRQIFTQPEYRALGGNPVEKIAITKLLLAIAQSAATPADDEAWANMGAVGLAHRCIQYLEKWNDRFWLYGERPFLQIPALKGSRTQPFGAVLPEISTGNTTVLLASQVEKPLSDGDRALLLITLMGFGLGGKKADNSIVLSPGYMGKTKPSGKPTSGKPGAGVGFLGYLHSFLQSESLQKTLWLNLFSHQQIDSMSFYAAGLGDAPWEEMPVGEACPIALQMQQSLMGRWVPLSHFCLLTDAGLHYSEGIVYHGYKEGGIDPTVAVNHTKKEPKTIWVDSEKRPWRQLTALLSFMGQTGNNRFDCYQISLNLTRARTHETTIGVWSGGLKVRGNAGEQYVSQTDDFVESLLLLKSQVLGELWYLQLAEEMSGLDQVAKRLYGATINFYKTQMVDGASQAAMSSNLFWQLAERLFQQMVDACESHDEASKTRKGLHQQFARLAHQAFDTVCPRDTARQLDAWAKCRPNLASYIN
ncbi:MAG: type I-E CRISPR-associated protein Cse1/CasA [Sedimenticola sp.]